MFSYSIFIQNCQGALEPRIDLNFPFSDGKLLVRKTHEGALEVSTCVCATCFDMELQPGEWRRMSTLQAV
jgi:hypothetical protein